MPDRLDELTRWLHRVLDHNDIQLAPASEDASFRRYFRATVGARHWIVMDAPPDREDVRPFVRISRLLESAGVNAPRVDAQDPARGFLLLTDLGLVSYLDAIVSGDDENLLYSDAINALVTMQTAAAHHDWSVPPYDRELLMAEMALFSEWLVDRHLGLTVPEGLMADVFDRLAASALQQPQVFVHRDYHSRNLMVCAGANPGILDFQDAVKGPVSYDLVSLLRDCYVAWPAPRVDRWMRRYRDEAAAAGLDVGRDIGVFRQWFDLMGIQRHLKAAGIFARLWHRDGKSGYLRDVPRTLNYVVSAARDYPEFHDLREFLKTKVLPALPARQPA